MERLYLLCERIVADNEGSKRFEICELLRQSLEHAWRHPQLQIVDLSAIPHCVPDHESSIDTMTRIVD